MLPLLIAAITNHLWYLLPLIVTISLVYGATRHEVMGPIIQHAIRFGSWFHRVHRDRLCRAVRTVCLERLSQRLTLAIALQQLPRPARSIQPKCGDSASSPRA